MIHIQPYTYIHAEAKSTIMTNEHTSLEKNTSHTLFEMVAKGLRKGYVWEVSWKLNKLQHIDPQFLYLLFSFCCVAQSGIQGPIALCRVLVLTTASYLQLTDSNSLNFLSHRVISLFDIHLLPVIVASVPNSTRPQSRLYPDIFDRMHLFLDWRLGRGSICYIYIHIYMCVCVCVCVCNNKMSEMFFIIWNSSSIFKILYF